jgi:hypothetical protein
VRTFALTVLLFLALSTVWHFEKPPAEVRIVRPPDSGPPPTYQESPKWTGSQACAACHPGLYERWSQTGHARNMRPFSPEAVAKPFDGEYFVTRDIEFRLGPGASMLCDGPGGEIGRYPIKRVLGWRRIQMFATEFPDGRIQILPIFVDVQANKWMDYVDILLGGQKMEIPPDTPDSWYFYARNFSSRCGTCHATNFELNYDPDRGTYASTWTEDAIGCEACHGAGGEHIDHWRQLKSGPDPMVNLAELPVDRQNQLCGYCHGENTVVVYGFEPGDDLFHFVDVAGLEDGQRYHPDGRVRELGHNFFTLLQNQCAEMSCMKCHDAHGRGILGDLYRPLNDDWMCTQCHAEFQTDIEAHTFHKQESEGSRCHTCHMPRMVIEGGHGRVYDHTLSTPSMANTKELGLPNACRDCHLVEDPGWEYESFQEWYPEADARNPRVALARAIAGGRAAKPEAKEQLLKLLEDRNPAFRAGGARLLAGGYGVDLRAQLKDPHPMVRRAAIVGVARTHPEELVPLLEDPSPVLRYVALMELIGSGRFVDGHPELWERLIEHLQQFTNERPDLDVNHLALGNLLLKAGHTKEAVRSFERYLRINPWDASTRSRLGRIKAR